MDSTPLMDASSFWVLWPLGAISLLYATTGLLLALIGRVWPSLRFGGFGTLCTCLAFISGGVLLLLRYLLQATLHG